MRKTYSILANCKIKKPNHFSNHCHHEKSENTIEINYLFMDIQEYLLFTKTTAIYPSEKFLEYLTLGLVSEAGEVAGVVKRLIRDNQSLGETKEKLTKELGDVLWYWVRLCDELDLNPEEIINQNVDKLTNRQINNTIQGEGDDR